MSEKSLFYLLHFIGTVMIIVGAFVSLGLLMLGVAVITTNAICMGAYCNIKPK